MNTYQQNLSQRIIQQAIKDLRDKSGQHFNTAKSYFNSSRLTQDCKQAGYPFELFEAVSDMLRLSRLQRQRACKEIIEFLNIL